MNDPSQALSQRKKLSAQTAPIRALIHDDALVPGAALPGLGTGYDPLQGKPYQSALQTGSQPTTQQLNEAKYHWRQIENRESFRGFIELILEGQYASPTVSGQGALKTFTQANTNSTNYVIDARVSYLHEITSYPVADFSSLALTQNAQAALQAGWDTFTQNYGTMFVSGVITGGHWNGDLTLSLDSFNYATELSAMLKGKTDSKVTSASLSATLNAAMQQAGISAQHVITVDQKGFNAPSPGNDIDSFAAAYAALGDTLLPENNVPIAFELTSWLEVPAVQQALGNQLPNSLNPTILNATYGVFLDLQYVSNSAQAILDSEGYSCLTAKNTLQSIVDQANTAIQTILSLTLADYENLAIGDPVWQTFAIGKSLSTGMKAVAPANEITLEWSFQLDGSFKYYAFYIPANQPWNTGPAVMDQLAKFNHGSSVTPWYTANINPDAPETNTYQIGVTWPDGSQTIAGGNAQAGGTITVTWAAYPYNQFSLSVPPSPPA